MHRMARDVERVVRRPYWRAAEARVIVDAWRRSGESQRAFAVRHGLDAKRVGRWARRLRGQPARTPPRRSSGGSRGTLMRFHPVQLREPVARAAVGALGSTPPAEAGPPIDVVLRDGRVVRVRRGFAPEDLHQVLMVLEAVGEPLLPRDPPC